jgi:phospholipid/cholesterol/gamma-HCH transport system substrate-binding protein
MRLTIRFADQIVGAFIILGLGILIFVIFMLGSNQRWFSRDYNFKTYFGSAAGLSQNMAVQYKGFNIGRVKSLELADDDRVEVNFIIFDTYINRVKRGSLVDVVVSPIGALGGSQFLFYPGLGDELLAEGETIPTLHSTEGKRLAALGLTVQPDRDDLSNDIGALLANLNAIVFDVRAIASALREAVGGNSSTSLGRTFEGLEMTMAGLQQIAETLPGKLEPILGNLEKLSGDLEDLAGSLANPDGTIASILNSEGDVYANLVSSLKAASGTLQNLEKTVSFLPAQLPQITSMINDLHVTIAQVEDVLVAVSNNPLLKRGIPQRRETNIGGANTRDDTAF